MRRRTFVFGSAGLASLVLTKLAGAQATHASFTVANRFETAVLVETGETGPLTDVRFVISGDPRAIRIRRIVGTLGNDPDMAFDPPGVTPHEATAWFGRHPLTWSASPSFFIYLDNIGQGPEDLRVTLTYR